MEAQAGFPEPMAGRWARPELLGARPPVHGGRPPSDPPGPTWLDFSTNGNAFLEPPPWASWWAEVALERYPDPESRALRAVLARRLGVAPEHLWVGNGACELIATTCLACLRPGDGVLVWAPAFSEYERAARAAHGIPVLVQAQQGEALEWDLRAVEQALAHPV